MVKSRYLFFFKKLINQINVLLHHFYHDVTFVLGPPPPPPGIAPPGTSGKIFASKLNHMNHFFKILMDYFMISLGVAPVPPPPRGPPQVPGVQHNPGQSCPPPPGYWQAAGTSGFKK